MLGKNSKTIKIFLRLALIVFTITIGVILGIGQIKPPVADETSPGFQRMMNNIERLARNPRYTGSDEIEIVCIRIQSPDTDRGILFVSHLDSWANSPGATDSMVSICAILEAMRALAPNKTMANNVYFLIT